MPGKIFTTYQVSQFCSVDISTVMGWVDDGKLAAYHTPGGHRRIQETDLLAFLGKYNMPVHPLLRPAVHRVLIVDDDPATVRVLKRLVEKVDGAAEIETALDGFAAGRLVEGFAPDLILLDLLLPGVDGFEVCRNIRAGERTARMKILAITALDDAATEKKIRACGADAFATKPFDLGALRETLAGLLSLSAVHVAARAGR